MLKPLSVGSHTIHFCGANADGSFTVEVTYDRTTKKQHQDRHWKDIYEAKKTYSLTRAKTT
jgi:hypothetical protein